MQHEYLTRAVDAHLFERLPERLATRLSALGAVPLVVFAKLFLLLEGLEAFPHGKSRFGPVTSAAGH